MLVTIAEGTYKYARGKADFTVAFLPGTIALAGSPGYQFFDNEKNLPPSEIRRLFPDKEAFFRRAALHKVGLTNKDRFVASVERLLLARKITEPQRNTLREFIGKCDCAPPVVRQKLRTLGYASVIDLIEFEDYHPELESTVDAMQRFTEELYANQSER